MNSTDYIAAAIEQIIELLNDPTNLSVPDPAILTTYTNLNERRIWLEIQVDSAILEYSKYIMRWNSEDAGKPVEDRKPIWLYIFNYGGSADYMWMLTDIIAASETPIYTINVGQCCSAAALIFMAGHKRFMMPAATVLIHEGSGEISGDAVKVLDQAESYKTMVKRMHNYILAHTRIPPATLTRKRNNDWEIDSETCLKYGICDHVVSSLSEIV